MATKIKAIVEPDTRRLAQAMEALREEERNQAKDEAEHATWIEKRRPAREQLSKDVDKLDREREVMIKRVNAELDRKFGSGPTPYENKEHRIEEIATRFAVINWLEVTMAALGGPSAAAKKVGRDARTIRAWLRRPTSKLSYHPIEPVAKALGIQPILPMKLVCLDLIRDRELTNRKAKGRAAA
jgi:hypothetical protein